MGRQKREFPQGKLTIVVGNKKKVDTQKEYPIAFSYTCNGESMKHRSSITAKTSDWNENSQQLRASYGNRYAAINNQLKEELAKYDHTIMLYAKRLKEQGKRLTAQDVRDILNGIPKHRADGGELFVDYVKKNLEARKIRNQIQQSRYENGISSLNIFCEFMKTSGKDVSEFYIGDLTPETLDEYIKYRKDVKNNKDVTVNHSLTPILVAMEDAHANGYIDHQRLVSLKQRRVQCRKVSNLEETAESFNGKFLTEEDLQHLVDYYNTCDKERRKEYIEMYLFAFHTCGMRLVDIMTLRWEDIDFDKGIISKIQVKTQKSASARHTIPLMPPALRILDKWRAKTGEHKFVFDLAKEELNLNNQEAIYKARNTADKSINQSLKVVGESDIMKLPFTLSFHSARHSFAMLALNNPDKAKRRSMYVVSRLLGHSSTAVTEKTYARFLPETLQQEVEALDFNFLPDL